MTPLSFYKYHGTGNDFILIDQREAVYLSPKDHALIAHLCHRHFGIGADGLILLRACGGYDFEMAYFNSDGHPSSMCGNGARCTVAFARRMGIERECFHFLAPDGPHRAKMRGAGWVEVEMAPVQQIESHSDFHFLDTGSPHYVRFVPEVDAIDVFSEGRSVRYSERFRKEGTNVNFVQYQDEALRMATYERGVENETLSCGTGVTAAALAASRREKLPPGQHQKAVQTKGGTLSVRYRITAEGHYTDIWLCGPATSLFRGELDLDDWKAADYPR
jgi:diaminopimelate epimerase